MSRWLNEPVTIGIATDHVAVGPSVWPRDGLQQRIERHLYGARVEDALVSFDIAPQQWATEAGVIDALGTALVHAATISGPQARLPLKRRVFVVLDDFWGYHTILHGDFRSLRTHEIEEIVLAHFADVNDIDAASVLVRFDVQRGGRAVFASALARSLYDAIHDAVIAADMSIASLTLWLPVQLQALRAQVASSEAMLLFVGSTLLQAVLVDGNGWSGYDAQRRFQGDPVNSAWIAGFAEQVFERAAPHAGVAREDYDVYLFGDAVDAAAFEGRFRSVIHPVQSSADWLSSRQPAEAVQ
ncbi:hypothetical protein [Paraburkholderia dinghuensis]|uniref:Uncharacterized protein n=1 Tax=Paraburkholderia dinghuensis TaxID=2305225 RepID=A0A3N6MP37_9BURK|nr:hypothetical protein [Paraburkholderia dinghuensis]RQH05479.1 hypothetical protein D1Y85_15615 [Paraburkholderia dinghuensis]